jgi:hypothetical protein
MEVATGLEKRSGRWESKSNGEASSIHVGDLNSALDFCRISAANND